MQYFDIDLSEYSLFPKKNAKIRCLRELKKMAPFLSKNLPQNRKGNFRKTIDLYITQVY